MKEAPLISVVIATYNGSAYLSAQLDSIYKQTYKNIEVIVCDDRSTDSTVDILHIYATQFGLQFYVNNVRQGVVRNFEKAISYAKGNYIALSDQDDVWIPEKLELSLHKLVQLEKEVLPGTPALVFSDLQVVDEKLDKICPSYWHYMQVNPANNQLNRVLVENVATGCTILMNKATVSLALPIPAEALMHDVWLLLTTTCFGKVAYLEEPTVLYRQHRANVIGAQSKSIVLKIKSAVDKLYKNQLWLLNPEIKQASAFYNRYRHLLHATSDAKKILETFITLKEKNLFMRKVLILKNSFFGSSAKKAINVLLRA